MSHAALVVDLTARLSGLQSGMDRAVKIAESSSKKIESAFSFSSLAKGGAAFFAGQLGVQSLVQGFVKLKDASDEWTRIRVLVQNVTSSIGEAERAQSKLYEAAQATRQNFGDLSRSYASFARNANELGITSDRAVALQTTVAQAIALSGARADSAASALVQFGQGIASGVLRGEELNSVLEQTPKLAKALADGMGVPIGQLIKMGKEGELSADRIIAALEKIAPSLQKEFDRVTPTIADSFVSLNNAIGNVLNRFNEIIPVAETLSGIIIGIAKALDKGVEFSRFDPLTITNDLITKAEAERRRAAALSNPANYTDPNSAINQRTILENQQRVRLLEAQIAALRDKQTASGRNADGTPLADNTIRNFQQEQRRAEERSKLADETGAVLAQLRGISTAFPKQAATLRAALEAGVLSRKAYDEAVTELLKKSGFFPKEKKEKDKVDTLGEFVTRTAEQDAEKLDKWREAILRAVDPLKELNDELDRIKVLRGAGLLTATEAAAGEADVQQRIADATKKAARERLLLEEPLTVVREKLDEYIESLRIEADALGLTEVQREARLQLLDAEKAGLARTSAEWETYRRVIEEALAAKRLGEIDQKRGGAADSRTGDLQLAVDDFNRQRATLLDDDPANLEALQEQFRVRAQAILDLNAVVKEDAFKLGEAFQSAFEKAIVGGEGLSKVLQGLLQDVAMLFIRQQITGPLAAFLNTSTKGSFGGDTLFSAALGLFTGAPAGAGAGGIDAATAAAALGGAPATKSIKALPGAVNSTPISIVNNVTVSGSVSQADVNNAVEAGTRRVKFDILDSMSRRGAFRR